MDANMLVVLLLLLSANSAAGALGIYEPHHLHLGCYRTASPEMGIEGLKYHYATLELSTCTAGCKGQGYAYALLQKGFLCTCVSQYGKGGITLGSACTATCNTDRRFSCGGDQAENVYYAVNTNNELVQERVEILSTTSATYRQARKECVKGDGDLVTLKDVFHMERLAQMVTQAGNSTPFWIGLSRPSWRESRLWSVPNVIGLDPSASSMYWATGHPKAENKCTLLDPKTLLWSSAPCDESHPYMCHQVPPPTTPPPLAVYDAPTTLPSAISHLETEDPGWAANKLVILYVILPFFILSFCGSCVAYVSYKSHKSCKKHYRKQAAAKATVQLMKPKNAETSPPTVIPRKQLGSNSRPLTARDVAFNETVDETRPPPYSRHPAWLPPRRRGVTQQAEQPEPTEMQKMVDLTKLSIADIIYVRSVLGVGTTRHKKRKIVSA